MTREQERQLFEICHDLIDEMVVVGIGKAEVPTGKLNELEDLLQEIEYPSEDSDGEPVVSLTDKIVSEIKTMPPNRQR